MRRIKPRIHCILPFFFSVYWCIQHSMNSNFYMICIMSNGKSVCVDWTWMLEFVCICSPSLMLEFNVEMQFKILIRDGDIFRCSIRIENLYREHLFNVHCNKVIQITISNKFYENFSSDKSSLYKKFNA